MLVITVPGSPPVDEAERTRQVRFALSARPVHTGRAFRSGLVVVVVGNVGEAGEIIAVLRLRGLMVTQSTNPLRFNLVADEVPDSHLLGGTHPAGKISSQNPISYV